MSSNEFLRSHYQKPVVQLSVLYFITFSLLSLILPFIFSSIDARLFILSGIISIIFIIVYVHFVSKLVFEIRIHKISIIVSAFLILACMNFFYFFRIIPPIPLSLRDAGIYHNIEHEIETYNVLSEKTSWLDKIIPGQKLHILETDRLFAYTAIFAPSGLRTNIVHKWQYYNKDLSSWQTMSSISFPINGGRDSGYRGYSIKSNATPGLWRVSVETENGQVLGRIRFLVEHVLETPTLLEDEK